MTFAELLRLARASRRSRVGRRLDSHTRTPEDLAYVRAVEAHLATCPHR